MRTDKYKEYRRKSEQRQWMKNSRNKSIRLALTRARHRARLKHYNYDLSLEWVLKQIIQQNDRCLVTRIPFDYSRPKLAPKPNQLSIDRISRRHGYVKGNVRFVTWIFNQARSIYDDNEVIRYLVKPLAGNYVS